MNREKLVKNFGRCIDWEDKYLYIMSLGEKYATLSDEYNTKEYRISGCQSQVWVKVELQDGRLSIEGNSDAALVRGLVSMVIIALNGLMPEELLATDIKKMFAEMGLQQQLTPARNQA
ncbi:SufE family protein [Veronia nyctiphanis]|uniref:SufE family protein n=1 Tax=Veronia nyctiphanis TaxID=1278244 RepID=UPI001F395D0B|nr:SufE family protein [Veronia nyctiphanis]